MNVDKVNLRQTFGDTACHPECNEGSGSAGAEILREPRSGNDEGHSG